MLGRSWWDIHIKNPQKNIFKFNKYKYIILGYRLKYYTYICTNECGNTTTKGVVSS
jgi:hypothetical protein